VFVQGEIRGQGKQCSADSGPPSRARPRVIPNGAGRRFFLHSPPAGCRPADV